MKLTADGVVIGGGIVGCSIACHLAEAGLKNIVLLEKEPLLGTGSSAASAGIIYHHLPEKINLQLSRKSLRAVLEFEEAYETRIDFRRSGCIQTAATPEELAELEGIRQELTSMEVEVQILRPHELAGFFPGLVVNDLAGAIYTPNDGYFDPHGMIQGYTAAARRLGARIMTGTPAIGLQIEAGRIRAVRTPEEYIETEIAIDAAGPMADEVARSAGLQKLPVVLVKRQIFISSPTNIVAADSPFYFDKNPPFYFRPESGGLLMSIAELEECPSRNLTVDWSSAAILAERATRRLPAMSSVRIVRGWAGLRSMTPDHTAILGPAPEPSGFYLAVGFSGHGVMHAPVTGKIIASMITSQNFDRCDDIDLGPLRLERFFEKR